MKRIGPRNPKVRGFQGIRFNAMGLAPPTERDDRSKSMLGNSTRRPVRLQRNDPAPHNRTGQPDG